MIDRYSSVCIFLQETMTGESAHTSPPGYRAFYSTLPVQGQHDSSVILVRNDVPYETAN